ncbi:conserved membrane hypothetical protein [Bradyrhizobium oligotrophicum S58]|uniref:DUF2157 domain-containing protein n=1 Tax=Bradyrhizobium oligotrophicum S58 TaxID=1245469 RepID=M4Z3Y6_9BRAD|nr:hypothetical protein [Bradyrhizobium oligotrophicum]BAM87839.1 conserved membrane hypothetical protein [Bradyrhizobium oligotrophicum S58]
MSYSDHDLRAAAGAGAISSDDLQRLLTYLQSRVRATAAPSAKFDAAHLLWYAGALIVIGAMGLFSTVAFSQMGGRALTACALAYAVAFGLVGNHLWRRDLRVPGGLLIAIAVSMAPLAVYGVQEELGWWGKFGKPGTVHDFYIWIKGSWLFMELATIVAGAIALRFYRVPFIVAIISVALWFMSMDLTPWIFNVSHFDWEMRRIVSIWFGLGILVIAWIVDYTSDSRDFGFWLHLFGLLAFWGGITATDGATELGKAVYCLLNVGLLAIAVIIVRRAYAAFGAIGITMYLGHLADVVFKNSLLFPFALSLIGVAVVAVGLAYHRKQKVIAEWLGANLPPAVLRLRPQEAAV